MADTLDSRWERRLNALGSFVNREGHALVPANHVEIYDGDDVNLGSWVSYLRTRYHANQLEAAKVDALETYPGWAWGPLRPGPKSDKERDTIIRKMREEGLSLREIGEQFGLSRQRIHQIISS